jgi:3-hydroxybutyryl-CoA dehydrogenase
MIRQITVIGSGTMGRGIAYLAALAGYDTVVHDVDSNSLDSARASIETILRKAVEKKKVPPELAEAALGRLQFGSDLESAMRGADLVIEAVPENFELKKELFAQADLFCGEDTILA